MRPPIIARGNIYNYINFLYIYINYIYTLYIYILETRARQERAIKLIGNANKIERSTCGNMVY